MINTVIFDFDGTMADTNDVVVNSWQHTYREYLGHEVSREEIMKSFGEPLEVTMKRIFPKENQEELLECYRSYQRDIFTEVINLFPGVYEAIVALKEEGYKIGIVTSRIKDTTCAAVEKFGLSNYIDDIVSCDDTTVHKPNPEPVLLALKNLESKDEETVMVGDSIFDILCGKKAGVKTALVSWAEAFTLDDATDETRPEYFIEKAEDLLNIQ